LPIALNVNDTEQVNKAVSAAHSHFGRLDVVLNNAGYALLGTVEEVRENDVRALFETNLLGTLRVVQAVLRILRQQRSGHIVGVSSVLGLLGSPLLGLYSASKWAFESLYEALAQEVKSFGIKVTILEPGAYATEFGSAASAKVATGLEPYAALRQQMVFMVSNMDQGDPRATPEAVLAIIDAEAPPLRFFVGSSGLPRVRDAYQSRLGQWEQWAELSNSAQGKQKKVIISI
jgi:NAD(P)-dependent dehydrogenase (short-subunit alcohol dehydrogenase family)